MLASKLLVALFSLPLAALAQDSAATTDAAATGTGSDGAAATTDAPSTNTGAEAPASTHTTKTKNVGADISNTGNGNSTGGSGNWSVVDFTAPSRDYYWVLNAENTAVWTPYTEPVNLVIFNSNNTIFAGNRTIAENVPAGTGSWKGQITDFTPGNNYIIAVAPVSDPNRKVGQTDGFWIKRAGYVVPQLPSAAASAAGNVATGSVAGGASAAASGAAASSAASGTVNTPPASSSHSGAGALAVSAGALVVAAAAALAF